LNKDVRLVASSFRVSELGLQRGTRILWLPASVAQYVWRSGTAGLPAPIARVIYDSGYVRQSGDVHLDRISTVYDASRTHEFLSHLLRRSDSKNRTSFDAPIAIVGCGGLGSNIAVLAGSLCLHNLILIDGDKLEASNLNRIFWASKTSLGKPKVEVLSRYIKKRFGSNAVPIAKRASPKALKDIVADYPGCILVFAADQATAIRKLVKTLHSGPFAPYVHAGYAGTMCVAGPLVTSQNDPCPFCDSSIEIRGASSFVAPSAAPNNLLIASFLVCQLILFASGDGSALASKRWLFDLVSGKTRWQHSKKNASCPVCT
jgi:hypothetical protein